MGAIAKIAGGLAATVVVVGGFADLTDSTPNQPTTERHVVSAVSACTDVAEAIGRYLGGHTTDRQAILELDGVGVESIVDHPELGNAIAMMSVAVENHDTDGFGVALKRIGDYCEPRMGGTSY